MENYCQVIKSTKSEAVQENAALIKAVGKLAVYLRPQLTTIRNWIRYSGTDRTLH
jgi:hypothetical protein